MGLDEEKQNFVRINSNHKEIIGEDAEIHLVFRENPRQMFVLTRDCESRMIWCDLSMVLPPIQSLEWKHYPLELPFNCKKIVPPFVLAFDQILFVFSNGFA